MQVAFAPETKRNETVQWLNYEKAKKHRINNNLKNQHGSDWLHFNCVKMFSSMLDRRCIDCASNPPPCWSRGVNMLLLPDHVENKQIVFCLKPTGVDLTNWRSRDYIYRKTRFSPLRRRESCLLGLAFNQSQNRPCLLSHEILQCHIPLVFQI